MSNVNLCLYYVNATDLKGENKLVLNLDTNPNSRKIGREGEMFLIQIGIIESNFRRLFMIPCVQVNPDSLFSPVISLLFENVTSKGMQYLLNLLDYSFRNTCLVPWDSVLHHEDSTSESEYENMSSPILEINALKFYWGYFLASAAWD